LATELRWILAGLSVLLIAGIWWWGARRSRQAPGNAELRESRESREPPGTAAAPGNLAGSVDEPDSRDWGVPPFEPLSIRTHDFEQTDVVDLPMTAHLDPFEENLDLGEAQPMQSRPPPATAPAAPIEPATTAAPAAKVPAANPPASSEPAPATAAPQAANASETQRIVSVRVCAAGESRWAGVDLMTALENHGLAHGRYQVFHRKHSDGRTLFCAASLVEPGTFDIARMPDEEFRGLTLFAVLPGPADMVQTLDALVETARELAETLQGTLQDSKGMPLTLERAAALREDVVRFQALLR
jgi:cell division protein ZipA